MFLQIPDNMTLAQLNNRVSYDNVGAILAANGLTWGPNVGASLAALCASVPDEPISWNRQYALLNQLTQDSDSFEYACLMNSRAWSVFSSLGTFPGMLAIPETVQISMGSDVLGDGVPVSETVYQAVMHDILTEPHVIDIGVFNSYSSSGASRAAVWGDPGSEIFNSFHIPWGDVTLYTSIDGEHVDFPVYPETVDDGVQADYTTMPEMIYQYEPWLVYKSSGPRNPKYTFHFHRDMWTGDHRDGKASELVRFCQAQCYPDYLGSAVIAPKVSLYICGACAITGVVNSVDVSWGGPIGLDGWYLECTLSISITEVATEPLNYRVVRNKPLIG